MASNTRREVHNAIIKRKELYNDYIARLCMQFNNSVIVKGADDLPKRYLLKVLRNKGGIAYDKQTKLYLPFVESGIDIYGLPNTYQLIGYNGVVLFRKPSEVVILRANDLKYPIIKYFENQANKLVNIDMAIEQNLESIKTMTIAEVSDDSQLLTASNMANARQVGATIIFKNKSAGITSPRITVESTGATYLVDKLQQAKATVLNETLAVVGISVNGVEKKERVNVEEVLASMGYAYDCLSTLIDTFNYDAEQGGLSIRLEPNTLLAKETNKSLSEDNGGMKND